MCDLYYHHHIWEFLDMVALQMNPTEVCSQIGLCQFNVPGQRLVTWGETQMILMSLGFPVVNKTF
jgi:hypothetical protein